MQRRAQEVIDRCWQRVDEEGTDANPVLSIHDVGAGGLSNAFPELVKDGGCGGVFDLAKIPRADTSLNPLELWSNESQERYVLAIAPDNVEMFAALCARERCPMAVVGTATLQTPHAHARLTASAERSRSTFRCRRCSASLRRMERSYTSQRRRRIHSTSLASPSQTPSRVCCDCRPIASKAFLIHIGDRSVGGLTVQDQLVGPWQVPVADCAVTLTAFDTVTGEAMALGERTPLAVLNAAASARMAVGEVITNIAAAPIANLSDIKLSANWMAACGAPALNDQKLFEAVRAVGMEFCPALGLTIPVGKDSMSMRTKWPIGENGSEQTVTSPLSLVVTGFAPVTDARRTLTPQLRADIPNVLLLIDLGEGRNRLGASCLAQVYNQLGDDDARCSRTRAAAGVLPRSAGRSTLQENFSPITIAPTAASSSTLAEMAFAGNCGLSINRPSPHHRSTSSRPKSSQLHREDAVERPPHLPSSLLATLFSEELGAVLQLHAHEAEAVAAELRALGLHAHIIGTARPGNDVSIAYAEERIFTARRTELHQAWSETSFHIQSLRDNPACAAEEHAQLDNATRTGLHVHTPFDVSEDIAAPFVHTAKPRVAVLREQGVNGQTEMAHAFARAHFTAVDVTMTDLLAGRASLRDFTGLAACGGFSYGDVLGAGAGWAKTILFNTQLREMFTTFFQREDTFTLGVCNGCQMMAALAPLIPGADAWPRFTDNRSRYEARLSSVVVEASPSLFFTGMEGTVAPIAVAHGEGRADFTRQGDASTLLVPLRFADHAGTPTDRYPLNPNGSIGGLAGVTTPDGRFTALMPHPERVFRTVQLSWHPADWNEASPWMRLFRNARRHVG